MDLPIGRIFVTDVHDMFRYLFGQCVLMCVGIDVVSIVRTLSASMLVLFGVRFLYDLLIAFVHVFFRFCDPKWNP